MKALAAPSSSSSSPPSAGGKAKPCLQKSKSTSSTETKAFTGGVDEPDHGSLDASSISQTNGKQGGRQQRGNAGDSTPVAEICRSGRQENMAPRPAQQGPVKGFPKRLQLYSHNGQKFSNAHLSDPNVWQNIAYARPGRIPEHWPYFDPGMRYWELKKSSTVVSTGSPSHGKSSKTVGCGVTCYNHVEGPWCEVQSMNGTRICILATTP